MSATAAHPDLAAGSDAGLLDSRRQQAVGALRSTSSLIALTLAVGLYMALCCQLFFADIHAAGAITYPLDDTYINMAMAKNLALHGNWGITPDRFGPGSSSPGYLLLLAAAYRLTEPAIWWPLAFSLGFGLLAVFAAWRLLREAPAAIQATTLAAIVLFAPLPILGMLGMEHTLHILMTLAFLAIASKVLAERRSLAWPVLLLVSAMVLVRFESLFLVAVAGLLFLQQRRIRAAFSMGVAASIPLATYSLIAIRHGGYWLPNSIALKGASAGSLLHAPPNLAAHFASCLVRAPHMAPLLAAIVALLAVPAIRADARARAMLTIVLGASILHLLLADVDWLCRYEAYLIVSSIAAIGFAVSRHRLGSHRRAAAAFLLFGAAAVWFLSVRTVKAEREFPTHIAALYSQQIQMARFLARYEPGAVVAANDIGVISYFADIKCLDLVGLADLDVFRLKRSGTYTTSSLAKLAADRGVQVAVVYDSYFLPFHDAFNLGPPLPSSWIRVAHWTSPYGFPFLGSYLVSFYATNAAEADKLQQSLVEFAPSLPPGVKVFYGKYLPRPDASGASQ